MFFLIIVAFVALIVLLNGGKIENLRNCSFKHPWLVLLALTLKFISITSIYQVIGLSENLIPLLRITSLLLVVVFVIFNYSLRGVPLIGLGLFSNFTVIAFNGGSMPISSKHAHLTATAEELKILESGNALYSFVLVSPETRLPFLGDVILMPDFIPLTRLFSVGDIFITLGAMLFVIYYLKK